MYDEKYPNLILEYTQYTCKLKQRSEKKQSANNTNVIMKINVCLKEAYLNLIIDYLQEKFGPVR